MLWDVAPARLVHRACAIAGRNLSLTEWHQYNGTRGPLPPHLPRVALGRGSTSRCRGERSMTSPVVFLAFSNDADAHLDLLKAESKGVFNALRDLDRQTS